MPKFLEEKLKKQYGSKSDIPYKIMNKLGFMRGNKETPAGAKAQAKHDKDYGTKIHGAREAPQEAKEIGEQIFGGKTVGKQSKANSGEHETLRNDIVGNNKDLSIRATYDAKDSNDESLSRRPSSKIISQGRLDDKLRGQMLAKMRK